MMTRTFFWSLVLTLSLGLCAHADDLVLKDGRYLQVEVLAADERGVAIRRIDNGGELFIPWALIREVDKDRIMIAFGLKEEAITEPTEEGVRIVDRTGTEWFGVPETPFEGQEIPAEFVVWIEGSKVPFKREAIRRIDRSTIPSLAAWSPRQLYERELKARPPAPESIDDQMHFARFAQSVNLVESAIAHLVRIRELDPSYKADWLANQLVRLEEAAKNQRFLDLIIKARRMAGVTRFDDALAVLNPMLEMQDLPAQMKVDAELEKTKITERRWRYFRDKVRNLYFVVLKNNLRKIAADEKINMRDAQNQARREVHKQVVAELAEKLKLDPKTEVQKMWEERVVNQPRVAFYASGSFIVLGKAPGAEERDRAIQRDQARARAEAARRNGGGGSIASGVPDFPKPPTPDEWWKRATISTRTDFLLAYFAENGGQLVVAGERRGECTTCSGQRTVAYAGSQGQVIRPTCPRCAGHGYDKGVAFK